MELVVQAKSNPPPKREAVLLYGAGPNCDTPLYAINAAVPSPSHLHVALRTTPKSSVVVDLAQRQTLPPPQETSEARQARILPAESKPNMTGQVCPYIPADEAGAANKEATAVAAIVDGTAPILGFKAHVRRSSFEISMLEGAAELQALIARCRTPGEPLEQDTSATSVYGPSRASSANTPEAGSECNVSGEDEGLRDICDSIANQAMASLRARRPQRLLR